MTTIRLGRRPVTRVAQYAGRRGFGACVIGMLLVLGVGRAEALDFPGVLPTSIGLPEVNVVLRPNAAAAPYTGLDSFGDPVTNLRLIYDTGASGTVLFEGPAQALGIPVAQFLGSDVVFSDFGVGGSTTFGVSDPIHMSFGNFVQDPPDPYTNDSDYPRQNAGLRLQLGPPGSAPLFISEFTQLGIVGMPAMSGRVSVINPKLAEVSFFELTPADTIHTYVYDPSVPPESGPGIPATEVHVELTMNAPGGLGGPSAGPEMADKPPRAWAAPSSIALSASGPLGPKPDTLAYTRPGLEAASSS